MTRVMDTVLQELRTATAWLSTNDLVALTGKSHPSVGRALRRLWYWDKVDKKKMSGDRFGRMQWATPQNGVDQSFPEADPPTSTVYVKKSSQQHAKRTRHNGSLATITPISSANQGDLIMQIEQGVEAIVSKLVQDQIKFSAHDITAELRKQVNDGTIQVDPGLAGTVFVQSLGKAVTKIEHPIVRDAVHALMTSGKYDYDRTHNGDFFEYSPKAPDPASTGSAPAAPTSSTPYDGSSTL